MLQWLNNSIFLKPSQRLSLRLIGLFIRIVQNKISPHTGLMTRIFIDLDLPLPNTRALLENMLHLFNLRLLQSHALLTKRKANGNVDLLELARDLKKTGMVRESSIEQWFTVQRSVCTEARLTICFPPQQNPAA